jgi:hypothetical protein
MLSTVEYAGKGQFRNQVETLFTVRKQFLSDDQVRYFISTNDFDLIGDDLNSGQRSSSSELSFVVDNKTRHLSGTSKDLALLEIINNECVSSLKEVTKENIGKTWKQSFALPFLDHFLAVELEFTLTAIQLKTKAFGEMIAVRALSEPFIVKVTEGKGTGDAKSRINAIYLFDPEIEDIYLSISVFEATTRVSGSNEKLRCEMATYKTDAAGVSVDLSDIDKKFEKFVRKVGLSAKSIKVTKESSLPAWAQHKGLAAAQVSNLCAAMACEGASNPVVIVCMPAAHTLALQSAGKLITAGKIETISRLLVKNIPGVGGMKIAVAPAFMGMSLGTVGAITGGTVGGTVAIAGGGGGGGSSSSAAARSDSTP